MMIIYVKHATPTIKNNIYYEAFVDDERKPWWMSSDLFDPSIKLVFLFEHLPQNETLASEHQHSVH